jgi:hypothetical protein
MTLKHLGELYIRQGDEGQGALYLQEAAALELELMGKG